MNQQSVRYVALHILMRIEKEGGFSHLLISQAIEQHNIKEIDEKLLTEIVYGTMERKLTLDYYLSPFIQQQKKLTDWVHMLLRMSVFQLVYLDKVPAYAIINEAVEIAKFKGHRGIASLVNGVLRNVKRKGVPNTKDIKDDLERVAIETSHPLWLVKFWKDTYGFEETKQMCITNRKRKAISVRVNRLKMTKEDMINVLASQEITGIPSSLDKHAIIIEEGNIIQSNVISEGKVTIQDISSMLAAQLLQVQDDHVVLDTCSAPGGKTTYLAEAMHNTGEIKAYDLHENKLRLINNHAERLGLTNIKTDSYDARQLQERHKPGVFDRILVDAPCTGFGVIRSKPDIIYHKSMDDMYRLQNIQLSILEEVAPLLKNDGKLVYSTCTVNPIENEQVIEQFLNNHSAYEVDQQFLDEINDSIYEQARRTEFGMQIFPHTFNTDGFFITRLVKND
ncbi:MAG TPA: 16S rRNA (cytosine(967)-C(5))-methyltransferase RsmB [Pseudogracilibacillus sp.]|nr:16S rRNA (cytosine(967)-C(5))-methyltransferase RsmB [Pseudogracilibacillus sp.]